MSWDLRNIGGLVLDLLNLGHIYESWTGSLIYETEFQELRDKNINLGLSVYFWLLKIRVKISKEMYFDLNKEKKINYSTLKPYTDLRENGEAPTRGH